MTGFGLCAATDLAELILELENNFFNTISDTPESVNHWDAGEPLTWSKCHIKIDADVSIYTATRRHTEENKLAFRSVPSRHWHLEAAGSAHVNDVYAISRMTYRDDHPMRTLPTHAVEAPQKSVTFLIDLQRAEVTLHVCGKLLQIAIEGIVEVGLGVSRRKMYQVRALLSCCIGDRVDCLVQCGPQCFHGFVCQIGDGGRKLRRHLQLELKIAVSCRFGDLDTRICIEEVLRARLDFGYVLARARDSPLRAAVGGQWSAPGHDSYHQYSEYAPVVERGVVASAEVST